MQSKDKFLLQSTIVGTITDVDELPPDTFNKDSGKTIEESKLRVVYVTNTSTSEDEAMKGTAPKFDNNSVLEQLKEERDAAAKLTVQLKQELLIMQASSHYHLYRNSIYV
ncbi:hypothetical protein K1719_027883 [Acacia pycnantha]|nr:hypothetical protein K1719_027883 [Acacia pycnantha]